MYSLTVTLNPSLQSWGNRLPVPTSYVLIVTEVSQEGNDFWRGVKKWLAPPGFQTALAIQGFCVISLQRVGACCRGNAVVLSHSNRELGEVRHLFVEWPDQSGDSFDQPERHPCDPWLFAQRGEGQFSDFPKTICDRPPGRYFRLFGGDGIDTDLSQVGTMNGIYSILPVTDDFSPSVRAPSSQYRQCPPLTRPWSTLNGMRMVVKCTEKPS